MNQRELADLVGVSQSTVSAWLREGMPCRHPGGRGRACNIDASAALAWLDKRGIKPNAGRVKAAGLEVGDGDDSDTYRTARAKRETIEAQRADLRLKQEAGELLFKDDVVRVVVAAFTEVRAGLEELPAKLASEIAMTTDEAHARALLTGEIERLLEHLSGRIAGLAEANTDSPS
ncbi:MAG TPA: terminase small subunit [Azoarcus taiwanensis]|nr:terminase small subunit [Azoarcus taiwanensis]